MSGEIGSAFVRIRPNTAGFQAEAEQGIKGALVGVGKIVGGIFAAQTFVAGVKDIATAAASHQAEFAVLGKTIEDAGASTRVFGKSIETLLEKEARLKGFHDEDLASSFTRLVSVSHNSAQAFKELGLAEDVARARHIDVATAAIALARAEQGSTISLSRLGIVIPKINSHVAALRHEHDLAVASGVKFTGQVGLQYKASLLAAAAADRQASKVAALTVVQSRFGGTAAVFGKTALGEFQTFQQQIHQFEVAIGGALLPTLTGAATGLGDFLQHLTASGQAARTAQDVMTELASILGVLGQVIQAVAPTAEALGHVLVEITDAVGVPGLLLAVATYKGLGLALSSAGGIATRFNALLAAGTAAQAASAKGADATRAAELAYAAAVKQGTAAVVESIPPTDASTAALNLNADARERLVVIPPPRVPAAPAAAAPLAAVSANGAAQAEQVRRQTRAAAESQTEFSLAGEQATRVIALQTDAFAAHTAVVRADVVAVQADAIAQDELARAVGAAGVEFSTAVTTLRNSFEAINAAHDAALKGSGTFTANAAALNDQGAASARAAEGGQALNGTLTENITLAQSAANGAREVAAEQLQLFDATAAATGALEVQNVVLAENTGLTAANALSKAVGAIEQTATAAASGLAKLGRGILALAGGTTTVAIAAAAGLAFVIYRIATAESAAQKATERLIEANSRLADSFKATAEASDRLSQLRTELPVLRTSLAQDRLNVATARHALETTNLSRGTSGYTQLVINLHSAQAALTSATREYNSALRDEHKALATLHADRNQQAHQLDEQLKKQLDLVAAVRGSGPRVAAASVAGRAVGGSVEATDARSQAINAKALARAEEAAAKVDFAAHRDRIARAERLVANLTRIFNRIPSPKTFSIIFHAEHTNAALRELVQNFEATGPSVKSFFAKITAESKGLTEDFPRLAAKLLLLADYAKALGRIPTKRETRIVLNAPNAQAALTGLLKILHQMELTGGPAGKKTAEAFIKAFLASLPTSGPLSHLFDAAAKSASEAATGLAAETGKELNASLKSIDGQVAQTQTTIRDAASKLAEAQRSLADTIRTGNQQIHDSIASADANLASIGDSISNMLDQFLDAQQKAGQGADISEKEFKRLRAKLEAGNGGVGTQTAAEQVAFQVEKGQTAATADLQKQKDNAKRGIEDLIGEFEKGQITIRQLNRGIAKILESDGFTYKKAGKLLGSFFVTGFKDAIEGIVKQAQAIAAVPAALRKGIDGQQPNIVRPLDTIHQVSESIAKAERERNKDAKLLHADQVRLGAQRFKQHAITNELLRRRAVAAETAAAAKGAAAVGREVGAAAPVSPKAAAKTLKVDLNEALTFGRVSKAQLNEIIALAKKAGVAIPQGLVTGIRAGGPNAAAETKKLAHVLLAELRSGLRAKSPSDATREIGHDFGLGLALGIADESPAVARRVKAAADRAVAAARAAFAPTIKTTLVAHQRINLVRQLRIEGDIHRADAVPKIRPALTARQDVNLLRQLRIRGSLRGAEAVPHIPSLTARQQLNVVRRVALLGGSLRVAEALPRLATRVIGQRVNVLRRFRVQGDVRLAEAVPRLAGLTAHQQVAVVRHLRVEGDLRPAGLIPKLAALTAHQQVKAIRQLRIEGDLRRAEVAPHLGPLTVRQKINVVRTVALLGGDLRRVEALPRLATRAIHQRINVVRQLRLEGDLSAFLRRAETLPRLAPRAIHQQISLLRRFSVEGNLASFLRRAEVPRPLPLSLAQRITVRRSVLILGGDLHQAASPPHLSPAVIRQQITVARRFRVEGDLAAFLRRANVVPRAAAARTIRQEITVARRLRLEGDLAAFLRRAEAVPARLVARAVRQQITVERSLALRGDLRAFLLRAETVAARIRDRRIDQRIELHRQFHQTGNLAAFLRGAENLPPRVRPGIIAQAVELRRSFAQTPVAALLAKRAPLPANFATHLIHQRVRLARELSEGGSRLRDLLSRLEPIPARIAPTTVRQAVTVARALVQRPLREVLGRIVHPPRQLPTRTITETVELERVLRPRGATIPSLVRRAEAEARRELRFAAELPLTVRVGADTASAASHINQFVSREDLRRAISLAVVADTDPAAKQLAAFAATARKVKLRVAEAPALHPNVRALTELPKLTVRHEAGAPVRAAVVHAAVAPVAGRSDTDREMLGELRAQRRTTAHGDELLLSEARRQTHVLNEIRADSRRKPSHPKPSHAPGDAARKARSAANHNLTP